MNMYSRRDFMQLLAAGGLAGLTGCATTAPPPAKRPNILFIFSDDHACQSISAYGSKINVTPNIDRIAQEGAIFRNNFCANSICAPSRATILTGKHSHINGKRTNLDTFDTSQVMFPGLLQENGYTTALIGKWHLKADPVGFDHWEVLPGQGKYYNPQFRNPEGERIIEGYNTDIVTDLSLDWLQAQEGNEAPFMLMCQYKAPHRTWMPGPDHLTMYQDETIPEPETLFDDYATRNSYLPKNEMTIEKHLYRAYDLKVLPPEEGLDTRYFPWTSYEKMTPEQKKAWDAAFAEENAAYLKNPPEGDDLVRWKYQRYIKNYLRTVASVDDNIGRLLDYLDETGQAENTIVIYSSDQGFFLGEHGLYDKRWMYEESLRMPLVMRWPGVTKPGTEIDALTQNIDFAPTFLDATATPVPEAVQGESLKPLLQGKKPKMWRDAIYYHYYEVGEHYVPPHEGVRTDRYKLIHYYLLEEWELFDLKKDPDELWNLYDVPEHADTVARMKRKLEKLKAHYQVPPRSQ